MILETYSRNITYDKLKGLRVLYILGHEDKEPLCDLRFDMYVKVCIAHIRLYNPNKRLEAIKIIHQDGPGIIFDYIRDEMGYEVIATHSNDTKLLDIITRKLCDAHKPIHTGKYIHGMQVSIIPLNKEE